MGKRLVLVFDSECEEFECFIDAFEARKVFKRWIEEQPHMRRECIGQREWETWAKLHATWAADVTEETLCELWLENDLLMRTVGFY